MGIYRSAIVGLGYDPSRARAAASLVEGQGVDLVRDYDNRHDDNAVAVFDQNRMLGYIPARHAVWVSEIIDDEEGLVAARVVDVQVRGIFKRVAESVDLDIYTGFDAANPVSRKEKRLLRAERETYLKAYEASKPGLQILRWLGESGKTEPEKQRLVMDSYIHAMAADRGLTVTSSISENIRDDIMALTGARSTAMKAAKDLALEDDAVEALAPCVVSMVKADSEFSPEEASAVSDLLKALRRSRDRTGR